MHIRTATMDDLDAIEAIYAHARRFMAESGNPTQWGATHPPRAMLLQDIALGQLYLAEEAGQPCGVFAFILGDDPTYAIIEQGSWLSDAPYGVIHRIASNGNVHGLLRHAVDFCAAKTAHLRIDTHADNAIMQRQIIKCGFTRCGIIRVRDGSPRIAFERVLS